MVGPRSSRTPCYKVLLMDSHGKPRVHTTQITYCCAGSNTFQKVTHKSNNESMHRVRTQDGLVKCWPEEWRRAWEGCHYMGPAGLFQRKLAVGERLGRHPVEGHHVGE